MATYSILSSTVASEHAQGRLKRALARVSGQAAALAESVREGYAAAAQFDELGKPTAKRAGADVITQVGNKLGR